MTLYAPEIASRTERLKTGADWLAEQMTSSARRVFRPTGSSVLPIGAYPQHIVVPRSQNPKDCIFSLVRVPVVV
jgi:hypothetical protein